MQIHNVGFHHCHDSDFFIHRPAGSGDNLLLLLHTAAIFTLDGEEVHVPPNSFFLYRRNTPQFYRCLPRQPFVNDWIHFLFEDDEEQIFFRHAIPYDTPIPVGDLHFLSFCVKSIAYEHYAGQCCKQENICSYLQLLFAKIEEIMHPATPALGNTRFEMLSTIRSKIYAHPYEQRTVDSTAHEIRMSPSAFQHLYRQYFGVSFLQDYIDSRIQYAKMLLRERGATVSEAAALCGYRSYAHFIRQFKQKTGMTPSEYKAQQHSVPQAFK